MPGETLAAKPARLPELLIESTEERMDFDQILLPQVSSLIGALTSEAIAQLKNKFGKTDLERALQVALGRAIVQFMTSNSGMAISEALVEKPGFLTHERVAEEFAKVLESQAAPDAELIGNEWKKALGDAAPDWDYAGEAKVLLGYFRHELTSIEASQGVLVIKALDEILREIVNLKPAMVNALKPRSDLRIHLVDQTRYIDSKTRDFVGRGYIFDEVDQFINEQDNGYFLLVAKPGFGKTALLAQWAKMHGYVSHFNIASSNITTPGSFLGNVCAQLLARFNLPDRDWPEHATQNPTFLENILHEISVKQPGRKVVIAIDALDEADRQHSTVNPLYLPQTISNGCYFVITTKEDQETKKPPALHAEPQHFKFFEEQDELNKADIRCYLNTRLERPEVQGYIHHYGLRDRDFVEQLSERSEYNFMYLHYVMGEIEAGRLRDREFQELPAGLKQYYRDHMQRMRDADSDAWFSYGIRILAALAAFQVPLTPRQIREASGLTDPDDPAHVHDVLLRWSQFLDEESIWYSGKQYTGYRLYHSSFREFLEHQPQFAELIDQARQR
jgi:hypothetical protein